MNSWTGKALLVVVVLLGLIFIGAWDKTEENNAYEINKAAENVPEIIETMLSKELRDWYQNLPNDTSDKQDGLLRAKYDGIFFAITDIKGEGGLVSLGLGSSVTINNIHIDGPLRIVGFDNIGLILKEKSNYNELTVYMPPTNEILDRSMFNGLLFILESGTTYGNCYPGDYVFIDIASKQVFVNGEKQ